MLTEVLRKKYFSCELMDLCRRPTRTSRATPEWKGTDSSTVTSVWESSRPCFQRHRREVIAELSNERKSACSPATLLERRVFPLGFSSDCDIWSNGADAQRRSMTRTSSPLWSASGNTITIILDSLSQQQFLLPISGKSFFSLR